jgi:hypothetical protein
MLISPGPEKIIHGVMVGVVGLQGKTVWPNMNRLNNGE